MLQPAIQYKKDGCIFDHSCSSRPDDLYYWCEAYGTEMIWQFICIWMQQDLAWVYFEFETLMHKPFNVWQYWSPDIKGEERLCHVVCLSVIVYQWFVFVSSATMKWSVISMPFCSFVLPICLAIQTVSLSVHRSYFFF